MQETTTKTMDILSCFQHLGLEEKKPTNNYLTVFSSSLLLKTLKWEEIKLLKNLQGIWKGNSEKIA